LEAASKAGIYGFCPEKREHIEIFMANFIIIFPFIFNITYKTWSFNGYFCQQVGFYDVEDAALKPVGKGSAGDKIKGYSYSTPW
jgi:hypothetical protein